jgi:hypothetical protein
MLRKYLPIILTLYIAFVFIQSLFFKFTNSPETQYIFGTLDAWGGSLGWVDKRSVSFISWVDTRLPNIGVTSADIRWLIASSMIKRHTVFDIQAKARAGTGPVQTNRSDNYVCTTVYKR